VIRLFILLLITINLNAFEDDDIDGVQNSNDLCPNTSFEDTVDEDGCPENQSYLGKLTLTLGSDINFDDTTTTDYTFYSNYNYNLWDFSLYNAQQSSLDSNNNKIKSTGDLYFSSSYSIIKENFYTTFSLGIKFPIGASNVSTKENDYFSSLDINYVINEKTSLLYSLSYTYTGDNNETNYKNPISQSLGVGYMINDKWYSSLSYQHSNSIYTDSEDYKAINFSNNYSFNKSLFTTLDYIEGFDKLSYKRIVSIRVGVTFE